VAIPLPKLGYICLIKTSKPQQLERGLKAITKNPTSGVTVLGSWMTFGAHDGVVAFTCDNPEDSMGFVLEKIRSIEGVVSTETLQGRPAADYTP
jgi:uncharacterized protein with GYD domain